jgi:hypothetical protein
MVIENDLQFRVSKDRARKFKDALKKLPTTGENQNPIILKAEKEAMESLLAELEEEITIYKASHVLKSTTPENDSNI